MTAGSVMDGAHSHAVLSRLNEQRSQGLFCDVTIVVEDVKFRAHKNILAACSGYFRSALTSPETWSAGQVLELMDLKSDVFASILNFIYCSKVTPPGPQDTGGLVAAGKRLGIPFLETLAEQQRRDERARSTDSAKAKKKAKREAPRPEDLDKGPRITNAFSITEVCPGNNVFPPLILTNRERRSSDEGQLPSNSPPSACLGNNNSNSNNNNNNETTHALSEHSYAVSTSTEGKDDSGQRDSTKACEPATPQPKQLVYRNVGPLKKRHRLRGTLCRSILPAPADPQKEKLTTITASFAYGGSAAPVLVMAPPALVSEAEAGESVDRGVPAAPGSLQTDLGPPALSPQTEDCISIYGCDHCEEIFTNRALLTIHAEAHKKRFVSHLFCKFCHKKFIHLKRLRNHELVCPKAPRAPPKLDAATDMSNGASGGGAGLHSHGLPNATQLPSGELCTPGPAEPLPVDPAKPARAERAARLGGGQRRYSCSVCRRVYVTLSSLKRHENVHSWQRAYPCHYCNKVFALAEYRTKHEIWHTGERRYQCIFCLETFMTYYILKNHQKSFHGIDPSLAVKKKSANGGLKASVYPIKLYRLLPMKFRKRQYKTYSQTFSESVDDSGEAPPEGEGLGPPFEKRGPSSNADTVPFPLTFMSTTKMVASVTPRLSFGKTCDRDADQSSPEDSENQRGAREEDEDGGSLFTDYHGTLSLQPGSPAAGFRDDPPARSHSKPVGHNVPFLNSLSTVRKLSELSASAKRVEDMTKEILQSSTGNLVHDRTRGTKTETYIAKPACPGPSVHGDAMPLCQITVKIGNEAMIRRRIKGSNLFPRKKRRIRELSEEEEEGQIQGPSQGPPARENSESPQRRLRQEVAAAAAQASEDPNDCDKADMLWRPYYSYKAKKKRKTLRFKRAKASFHGYAEAPGDRAAAGEAPPDRSTWPTDEGVSGCSGEAKRGLSRNSSPRTTYSCDICDSSFITEAGLKAHVIGSHPCFCRTCGKQGPPGEAPAGGDYVCNRCMENGSCFDNAARSPNPEKKYRCSFCPQRFLYLATKRSHEKKHREANEEGYHSDNFSPCSDYSAHLREDAKQGGVKTEDGENQGAVVVKTERLEEGHCYGEQIKPKIEDTNDSMSLTHQDMSDSNIKSPLLSPTTPKMKYKIAKQGIIAQHSMHLISQKPACDRGGDGNQDISTGPRTSSDNDAEKSCKLSGKNDSETKDTRVSIHKPEKWMCKEEPFF